jgi:hypothetical protein
MHEEEERERRAKRRVQGGITTTNLIFSAYVGRSEDLFPKILALHVPKGSVIADITYGKGIFWKKVKEDDYIILKGDLKWGVDCRSLPYKDESIDCVVFDPPHMEGLYRYFSSHLAGHGSHAPFRLTYGKPIEQGGEGPKWHDAVLDLYQRAGREVNRVLRKHGIFIVKCTDEVSANIQHPTHIEITNYYVSIGFYLKDLFILVRPNRPCVSRLKKQVHARKNHSFFLVFEKLRRINEMPPIKIEHFFSFERFYRIR